MALKAEASITNSSNDYVTSRRKKSYINIAYLGICKLRGIKNNTSIQVL